MSRHKARAADGAANPSPRRAELLNIARDLFGKQGYRTTTVRDIADRANILSGSLFYHFETKESIVEEMLRPYLEEVVRRSHEVVDSAGSPAEALENLIVVNIRIGVDKLAESRILLNDRRDLVKTLGFLAEATKQIDELWMSVLRAGVADGTIRDDVDLGVFFRAIRGAVLEFVDWYRPNGSTTVDDVVHTFVTTFLNGILANPRKRGRRK